MRAILQIIRKEFIQAARDRKMIFIILVAPVFQLIILGYAANLDVRNIQTVVCDLDRTPESRALVSEFSNSGYFVVNDYAEKISDLDHYLDYGKASFALVIPKNFGSKIIQGRTAQLQILVDGSESSFATSGLQYASIIALRYSQNVLLQTFSRMQGTGIKVPRLNPEIRIWYNPELRSRNFMIPGVLALLLMIMTTMLTSLAVVKEKEVGTMEQLIVTPIRSYALIIGKLAPFSIIGMIDVVLVLLVASFWFKVPPKGSVPLLFLLCMLFLMTTLGLGLLVSTLSKTQQQAMMSSQFFIMMPMIYLSGFVFPIENMPKIIQLVTFFLPLRYFIVIIRGLFMKGVGWHELWAQALMLLLFGIAILSISIVRFRKKIG